MLRFIKKAFAKLGEVFVDDENYASSMRIIFVIFVLSFVVAWLYVTFISGEFIHFSDADAVVLGLAFGSKALQSYCECKK